MIRILLSAFLALLLIADAHAESYRKTIQNNAESSLEAMGPDLALVESGERLCMVGAASLWGLTVVQNSAIGEANGLRLGDKFLSVGSEEVSESNFTEIMRKYRFGDELKMEVLRSGVKTQLDVVCADRNPTIEAWRRIFATQKNQDWDTCIQTAYEADRLLGERSRYTAYYRLQCNEAKRCRRSDKCKTPDSQTAKFVYEARMLALQEAVVAGELSSVRAEVLSGIEWLSNVGYSHLASDLREQLRANTQQPRVASSPNTKPARKAYGTCFAVSPNKVITSYHVVENADQITIDFENGMRSNASLSQHSRSADLAVLEISGSAPGIMSVAPARSLQIGEEIFTLGYPVESILGGDPKFTEGSVSALSGLQGDATYFQMSVPIQPGNSGGPVVNMEGKVVGIVASTAAIEAFYATSGVMPQNINWATKSENLRLLMDVPSVDGHAKSRTDAIAATQAALCRVEVTSN